MTVDELIDRLLVIYPSADPAALKAMKSVYYAHLDKWAGDDLLGAAEEVFGFYRSTRAEPFPKPFVFKEILVTRVKPDTKDAQIRRELDDRANRAHINIQNWIEGQGRKIKATRPDEVYRACLAMARDECGRPSWRHLTVEQIKLCEMRALSQERVKRHGPLPKTNDAHWAQIEGIAADWDISVNRADWQSKERVRDAA